MLTKIAFIGSGIATSYTLISLLEKLQLNELSTKVEFLIIEKSNDFFKGVPYGNRSGKSVLLIQDLKNFISDPQRTHFINWLNKNSERLSKEFMENGGTYASKWVKKNRPIYEKGEWDNLYVPRFFFGNYINEEVLKRTEGLIEKKRLTLKLIQKEAVRVTKSDGDFKILFGDGSNLKTNKVVLSVGSLPYKKLYQKQIKNKANALYIKEPYGVGMEENMAQITNFIKERQNKNLITKIAVLGANASGLEIIYKICDKLPIEQYNTSFKSLSSHGVMPDGKYDLEKAKKFKPFYLESLKKVVDLDAKTVSEAANKDIDEAEKKGIGAATTVGIISEGFGALLPKLSKEELLNFAYFYGNQIGRRQRCAGNHYLSVISQLSKLGRFEHIKGRFVKISENSKGLQLTHKPKSESGSDSEFSESFQIIVNCLGSINLESTDLTPFIKNLIHDGLCIPNPSQIGFHVNKDMQASENFYIAGPLLAGNQIQDKVFWHLEHCQRIIWSSEVLSEKILSGLKNKSVAV